MIKKTKKRQKVSSYTYVDMWRTYPRKKGIERTFFTKVLKVFFALMAQDIIEKGKIYQLPRRLGAVGIMKHYIGDRKIFDYPHYKATGERRWRIRRQDASDPFMAFWKWYKHKKFCTTYYKQGVKFFPSRANKKHLSRHIKTEAGLLNYWS